MPAKQKIPVIEKAKEVIFAGDGAVWIKKFCRECFPHAIYVLDFWHLTENFRRAFGKLRRQGVEFFLKLARQGFGQSLYLALLRYYRRARDPGFRD